MNEHVTLNYQDPSTPESALRRKVCGHASGNGGSFLVFSVPFGIATWWEFQAGSQFLTVLVTGCISFWYFAAGVFYVCAGVMVLRPNRAWESLLVTCSWINAIFAALLAGGLAVILIYNPPPRSTFLGLAFIFGVLIIHWTALGTLACSALRLRGLG